MTDVSEWQGRPDDNDGNDLGGKDQDGPEAVEELTSPDQSVTTRQGNEKDEGEGDS
jgi:hypothetical protein